MANRVMVKPHVELVSIRTLRKGGKPHTMGTVMVKNVTVRRDGLEGDLLDEFTEVRELGADALKHMTRIVSTARGFVPAETFDAYVAALDAWIEADDAQQKEPEFPATVTGNMYRAAYVCGPEFYVSV